ncbi:hypothetical protein HO133_004971 [Letharia lupina]|uniref:Uncharacterized protein n=1 Tax=Letharia lupina TaxID=560253 RepID=A0A8H6C9N5_9LECA|nr:uncharacterized protein HO133_004971 [Letharia lupina]KAF6219146.1 hypothetical protein HO133_004971 [Letharia lupina]
MTSTRALPDWLGCTPHPTELELLDHTLIFDVIHAVAHTRLLTVVLPGRNRLRLFENDSKPNLESSSDNSKRRSAALADSNDESDLFVPSLRQGTTLKKQRLESSAPKQRAVLRAKVALNSDNKARPEPRGQPEVWAEMRRALCESLTCYQAYQSGAYTWGSSNGSAGYAYGFLLDNDNDDYGYMDEKVVITRLGGWVKSTWKGLRARGRTSAHRTEILQPQSFRTGFLNEYILFGLIGPLNADDDNFITRWMVEHGWKLKIQYSEDACIETTLGEYPKFLSQCMRWARTTWRSNPLSLLSSRTWTTQPWSIYAVYLTSFVNFALFYDAVLLSTPWIYLNTQRISRSVEPFTGILTLCFWIFCTKLIKPRPHFRRHPRDLASSSPNTLPTPASNPYRISTTFS